MKRFQPFLNLYKTAFLLSPPKSLTFLLSFFPFPSFVFVPPFFSRIAFPFLYFCLSICASFYPSFVPPFLLSIFNFPLSFLPLPFNSLWFALSFIPSLLLSFLIGPELKKSKRNNFQKGGWKSSISLFCFIYVSGLLVLVAVCVTISIIPWKKLFSTLLLLECRFFYYTFICTGIRLLFRRMFFPCKPEVVMVGEGEVSIQQGEVLVWGNGWPLTLAGGLTAHDAFPASLQTHLGSVLQRSTPVHYCSTLTCAVILTHG